MLEKRSALAAAYKTGPFGRNCETAAVVLQERLSFNLLQVSVWPNSFKSVCQKIDAVLNSRVPVDCLTAFSNEEVSIFRVAPDRLWIAGAEDDDVLKQFNEEITGDDAVTTEIGHSRTVMRVSGAAARTVLNRGLPIDLEDRVFPVNAFAQSIIHHIPVLVHRVSSDDDPAFDVYVSREYAVSFWEWLIGAASPLGGMVADPG